LVLGQYDRTGALVHIGQTGGGLKDADLRLLRARLDPLATKTCPFAEAPDTLQPATWVGPEVVVEVEYGERTPDGKLRAPVFLRVRDDIPAKDARLPEDAETLQAGTGIRPAPGTAVAERAADRAVAGPASNATAPVQTRAAAK